MSQRLKTPPPSRRRLPHQSEGRTGSPLKASDRQRQKVLRNQTRQIESLLSGKDRRAAASIIQEATRVSNAGVLAATGDARTIAKARRLAQQRVRRQLTTSVPRASEIRALLEKQALERARLVRQDAAARADHQIDAAIEVAPPALLAYDEFEPPFEAIDDATPRELDSIAEFDRSLSDAASGRLVIESFWERTSRYMLPSFGAGGAHPYTGVTYRVPRTGHLSITAVARNLFNHVAAGFAQHLGYSDGEVGFTVSIGIVVVRSGEKTWHERTLLEDGLISHGADISHVYAKLPSDAPYLLNVTTADAFLKGESVQIGFFARCYFSYLILDETLEFYAHLQWQLDKLFVKVD